MIILGIIFTTLALTAFALIAIFFSATKNDHDE
jgi:hypothetical protein